MARTADDLARVPVTSRPSSGIDHVYAGYFALQAAVGIALWVGYAASPALRSWTGLVPDHQAVTTAFAYPDLGLIVIGSLLSAWAVEGRRPSAVPFTALTAGAVLYPTLYLLGWVAMTHHTGTGTLAMMLVPALVTSWISYQVWTTR